MPATLAKSVVCDTTKITFCSQMSPDFPVLRCEGRACETRECVFVRVCVCVCVRERERAREREREQEREREERGRESGWALIKKHKKIYT